MRDVENSFNIYTTYAQHVSEVNKERAIDELKLPHCRATSSPLVNRTDACFHMIVLELNFCLAFVFRVDIFRVVHCRMHVYFLSWRSLVDNYL